MSKSSSDSHRSRLVDAAIQCFEQYGVQKTTVEDIARAAGLARATFYRTFPSREDVYNEASYKILGDIASEISPLVNAENSFADALVVGVLEATRRYTDHSVGMMLLEATGNLGVERFLIDAESPVVNHMLHVFSQTFERARTRGDLRDDISLREIAAWVRSFTFILVLNTKLTDSQREAAVRTFLLPSLQTPKAS